LLTTKGGELYVDVTLVTQYQNYEKRGIRLSLPKKSQSPIEVPKHMYRRLMTMYRADRSYKEIRDAVQHAFVDAHITLEEYDEMMDPSMIRTFISIDRQFM